MIMIMVIMIREGKLLIMVMMIMIREGGSLVMINNLSSEGG